MNIAQWYAFKFFFTTSHYEMAYIAAGALAVHIGVKLPVIRRALGEPLDTGVVLSDLVATVGGTGDSDVRMISLEPPGPYSRSVLPAVHARDSHTLVALKLNGETPTLDHGYPCRLIAASRPGVLQTKWLSRIEVVQA